MTTTAQSIIKSAQEQLQDLAGVRWSAIELVEALNDGQRETVNLRPDTAATTISVALVAGAKQSVPAACSKLIDITRNTNGQAVRQADRNILDALNPNWYSQTGTAIIKHFMRDERDAATFHVYPPAISGASLDMVYAPLPADVATPAGTAYSDVTGNINVADVFKNALLHFVLFRAFSKDAEFGGNAELSGAHYQLFKSGLLGEASTRQAVQPTVDDKAH